MTAISVFDRGSAVPRASVSAGEIGKLWGLGEIQIGDAVGRSRTAVEHHFAPPTLETVVVPRNPDDKGALRDRSRPARRAGPADRRTAGRRPPGAVRLALRRGPEGGHPGDAGERLRPRRHVPRNDDDLHRAADRHRRGCRDSPRGVESVPRHDRAADRPCAYRLGHRVPAARSTVARFRCSSTRRSKASRST